MIELTVMQAFLADFFNLVEIAVIYRILIRRLSLNLFIIDLIASFIIVSIPTPIGSIYPLLLVFYFWIGDRIELFPYRIINSIIAMMVAIIMSMFFDLTDYYTYISFLSSNKASSWIVLMNDFVITIIGIVISVSFSSKIQWFKINYQRPINLWKQVVIFFLMYISLSVITEKMHLADRAISLFLLLYLTVLVIGISGFLRYIKVSFNTQHQQRLIDNYKAQIASAHKINKQYNEIRRERHDTRNMLLSIQGYIRDHKNKEAEELLATFLQNDTVEKHYGEIDNALDKIKISGLHNLIKEKAYKIVEKGIPFSFEVNTEIDELPGSEIKTARIIGILMDNAIEATFKQAKPYIQFALLKHSREVYELVIANSIEQKLNINTALKFEHSTKEGHQGIGLSNVTQLVENDDHYSFSAEVKDKVIMMTCFIQRK